MTTPVMEQYFRAKREHPDALLFFHLGDFYEMFFEDAKEASRALGLTLTSRSRDASEQPIPMAGVPVRSVDAYLKRLIRLGYRVALCEQLEDADSAKGLVDRGVTRVITPGALLEDGALELKDNNFLLAIAPGGGRLGLAWLDLSTGSFVVDEVDLDRLPDEIARIRPAEALVPEGTPEAIESAAREGGAAITRRGAWTFDPAEGERAMLSHLGVATLLGFGIDGVPLAVGAAGAAVRYLAETQKTALPHLRRVERFRRAESMTLDRATMACLEIVRTLRGEGAAGTLLSVLDRTVTPMGGRLLKTFLTAPLARRAEIERRQSAVRELFEKGFLRADLRNALLSIHDVERLAARIACGRAHARDCHSLAESLSALPGLKRLLGEASSEALASTAAALDTLDDVRDLLDRAVADDAPMALKEGGLVKAGFDPRVDELRAISRDGASFLRDLEAREAARTGIESLKVGFNRVFGYYIEVTHANAALVPKEYHRKQTLKSAERYVTDELKAFESKVLGAEERLKALEYEVFTAVRARVGTPENVSRLQAAAAAVALFDVFASLAEVAARNGYVAPVVDDGNEIEIVEGRHPVLETALDTGAFVPNDLRVGRDDERVLLVTGPNMAGKSTYIRQAALIVLLAQTGSFVPAKSARVGVVDRIFTRVGAADELAKGLSTFMVEMTETANILNHATAKSLVILDEVGRGTSTFDGLAIAWAITEHLAEKIRAKTLFATHYHQLTDLEEVLSCVRNLNVLVSESDGSVTFLHKIVPGGTDKSYGIHVAHLAGIPRPVVERARRLLAEIEDEHVELSRKMQEAGFKGWPKRAPRPGQLALFPPPSPSTGTALERLEALDPDVLSPGEALDVLKELSGLARKGAAAGRPSPPPTGRRSSSSS